MEIGLQRERGCSINDTLLSVHGSSLGEKCITVLRIVKDEISRGGGVFKGPITKKMILSVKNVHAKYQVDLEAKRKLVELEVACKRQLEVDGQE